MKLTNKKTSECNRLTTTLPQVTPSKAKSSFRILHIFAAQPRLINAGTTQFDRLDEKERIELEAELKRNQGRTYAGILPPR